MVKKNINVEITDVKFKQMPDALDFCKVVNEDSSIQFDYNLQSNKFVIRDKTTISPITPSKNVIHRDYTFTGNYKYNKLPSRSKITIEFPLSNGDSRKITMTLSTNNPKDVADVSRNLMPTIEKEISKILQNEFAQQVLPLF